MSSREGGCSAAPFNWLNLGAFVGDDDEAVRRNRETFAVAIGASPVLIPRFAVPTKPRLVSLRKRVTRGRPRTSSCSRSKVFGSLASSISQR